MAETGCFDANEDLVGFWEWNWDVIVEFVGFVVDVDLNCFHCCFGAVLFERVYVVREMFV